MSRKASTVDSRLIPIAMSLIILVAVSEARPSSRLDEGGRTHEDSIDSGIRSLEFMRREIVESSPKVGEDGRDGSSMEVEADDSGFSRFSEGRGLNGGDFKAVRETAVHHPRRHVVTSAMYEALAKLANVQIADPRDFDGPEGSRNDEEKEDASRFGGERIYNESVDEGGINEGRTNFGLTRTLKTSTETSNTEESVEKSFATSTKLRFIPRTFQCRPISEIYIPNVDVKMPAYACTLGKRAFVISSERFIQDSRDYFEVNVDESTYKRLIPMTSAMTTLTSGVSVLPATLVLNHGEDGYAVRGFDADWKELQAGGVN